MRFALLLVLFRRWWLFVITLQSIIRSAREWNYVITSTTYFLDSTNHSIYWVKRSYNVWVKDCGFPLFLLAAGIRKTIQIYRLSGKLFHRLAGKRLRQLQWPNQIRVFLMLNKKRSNCDLIFPNYTIIYWIWCDSNYLFMLTLILINTFRCTMFILVQCNVF